MKFLLILIGFALYSSAAYSDEQNCKIIKQNLLKAKYDIKIADANIDKAYVDIERAYANIDINEDSFKKYCKKNKD